jgi:hypothetical protein
MLVKVCSAVVNGIEDNAVEAEVSAGHGDTLIVIVVSNTPERLLGWSFAGL